MLLTNSLAGTTTSEKNRSNGHRAAESHLFLCRQPVASLGLISQLNQYREAEYPICPLQEAHEDTSAGAGSTLSHLASSGAA